MCQVARRLVSQAVTPPSDPELSIIRLTGGTAGAAVAHASSIPDGLLVAAACYVPIKAFFEGIRYL